MIILVFRTSSYMICIKQHDGIQGIDQLQRVPTAGRVVLASGLKLNSYRRSYDVIRLACLSNLTIRICSLRLKAGLLLSPFNDIPSLQPFHGDNDAQSASESRGGRLNNDSGQGFFETSHSTTTTTTLRTPQVAANVDSRRIPVSDYGTRPTRGVFQGYSSLDFCFSGLYLI